MLMKNLLEIEELNNKAIYLYFSDNDVKNSFIENSEKEGICFEDEVSVKERKDDIDRFMRLYCREDSDFEYKPGIYVCFIGFIGHMRIFSSSNSHVVIDYKKYINGECNYILSKNELRELKNKR